MANKIYISLLDILRGTYIRIAEQGLDFSHAYSDIGITVVIVDRSTHAPIASGFAMQHPGETSNPYIGCRIAARRACADFARQNVAKSYRPMIERELYRIYRKRAYGGRERQ